MSKHSVVLALTICFCGLIDRASGNEISGKVLAGSVANVAFLQGEISKTGRSLDIGIGGEGWIPLKAKNGSIVYTRHGSLGMNSQGLLCQLPSGLPLLFADNGQMVPYSLEDVARKEFAGDPQREAKLIHLAFTEDGVLQGFYSDGQTVDLRVLTLAAFENARGLVLSDRDNHLYKRTRKARGVAFGHPLNHPFGKVFPQSLEVGLKQL